MNTDDRDVGRYLRTFTDLDEEQIAALAARPSDRDVHRTLATEVTALVHGPEAAKAAQDASSALFGGDLRGRSEAALDSAFADAPSTELGRARIAAGVSLIDVLAETGLVASKSAARQAVTRLAEIEED